jgi:hypothetical protein
VPSPSNSQEDATRQGPASRHALEPVAALLPGRTTRAIVTQLESCAAWLTGASWLVKQPSGLPCTALIRNTSCNLCCRPTAELAALNPGVAAHQHVLSSRSGWPARLCHAAVSCVN